MIPKSMNESSYPNEPINIPDSNEPITCPTANSKNGTAIPKDALEINSRIPHTSKTPVKKT